MVFYSLLFAVPTICTLIYTGGRTQLSRDDLLKSAAAKQKQRAMPDDDLLKSERAAAMNKVMFQTSASMEQDWVSKRRQKQEACGDTSTPPRAQN